MCRIIVGKIFMGRDTSMTLNMAKIIMFLFIYSEK